MSAPMVSAAPLIEELRVVIEARGRDYVLRRVGVSPRNLERVLHLESIRIATADRWAVGLGLHPTQLWANDFYVGLGALS